MKMTCKLSALALSLIGLCSFASSALAKGSDLDAVVQNGARHVMQEYAVPGLVIAVSANGKQHFYSFGVASKASKEPVTPDTLFEVGSVSKLFTATLATYAQAQGKLSLSDTVGKYEPELEGTPFGKVTLAHLATHTAGGFPLQLPDSVQDERQLMDYLKRWKPAYPMGTQRSYANPSIGMLGVIAAKSLNLPFTQAMEQQLFPALGLHNTYYTVPASKMTLYAQGYDKQDAPVRLNSGVLGNEAYGVKTSARDLIHFTELNLGQGETSPQIRKALADTHTGYFRVGPMTQDLIWEQYPYPVELKSLLAGNSNKMAYENNGAIALNPPLAPQQAVWVNKTGSTGGFGAYAVFVPAKQKSIVILANKNYPNDARVKLAYEVLKALD
ncbi:MULTISPECIES: class C beta-lactamase [Pseudomonas]|uniref:Beta-lactamase n=1 Tax=Pseudomonas fluorescens TaxID=294 RepID=A0A5E6YQ18_PSEFL|nr:MULTISPECIES: class C beta-lactamase [Pseudomonas]PAA14031.1 class C beta-lactamase [Pseudomonas fragi]VVN56168.1 Beta-lactamase [Pseudomonas fluorescens]